MSLSQLRNVNFGRTKLNATGSSGVGYQVLDTVGSVVSSRTTAGVYQTAPGIYAAYISFPDDFRGQILWDTGTIFPTTFYATEAYNVEENDPRVSSTYTMVSSITGTITQISYDSSYISSSLSAVSGTVGDIYSVVLDISSSLGTLSSSIEVLSSSIGIISSSAATISALEPKIDRLIDIQYGKWQIISNQMIFYKEDNITEIARFDLFDENDIPSMEAVFKRVKV